MHQLTSKRKSRDLGYGLLRVQLGNGYFAIVFATAKIYNFISMALTAQSVLRFVPVVVMTMLIAVVTRKNLKRRRIQSDLVVRGSLAVECATETRVGRTLLPARDGRTHATCLFTQGLAF
jgi:hypothetical protein